MGLAGLEMRFPALAQKTRKNGARGFGGHAGGASEARWEIAENGQPRRGCFPAEAVVWCCLRLRQKDL